MTDTRPMLLGGRTFDVPPLPLGVTIKVYPICREMSSDGGLLDRSLLAGGVLEVTEDELRQLADVIFLCAKVAEPGLTRADFDALPITPPQLLDAFLVARYQTGAWLPPTETEPSGEAKGEAIPQASTSTASSDA